jgi:hypothetical protein
MGEILGNADQMWKFFLLKKNEVAVIEEMMWS